MSGEKRTPGDHQLSSIQIPDELKEHYKVLTGVGVTAERGLNLKGLSRVNLFVGPNNSGKSRFLRGVAAAKELRFRPRSVGDQMMSAGVQLRQGYDELLKLGPFREVEPFDRMVKELPVYDSLREGETIFTPLKSLVAGLSEAQVNNIQFRQPDGDRYPSPGHYLGQVHSLGRVAESTLGEYRHGSANKILLQRLYIPTLRGLRPLPDMDKDVYFDRVKKDFFSKELSEYKGDIFTGMSLYEDLRCQLLGDRLQRQAVKDFEEFLSQHLFGKSMSLIPRIRDDVVHVKVGNEKERPIYELGDGVQNVITLTFPIFSRREKQTLIFIEEPELFLHPGMQRTLMKAMMQFKDHQYFVSTHSNHLLDLAMEPEFDDVSIFKLRKETGPDESAEDVTATFTVELAVAHDHHLLEMLGTRVSSVFLSNCTIWVEGVTDRRYFAHFLKLYSEHLDRRENEGEVVERFRPRQDYHYSFVEYSGGNITHWSFLDEGGDAMKANRLCACMMLIADRDEDGKKEARHEKLRSTLEERFNLLECREVENLLTPEVIKAVLAEYGEDVGAIEAFEQSDYTSESLGAFIMSKLSDPKRRGGYAEESGTIKDKLGFCEKAVGHMEKFEELSPEARELTVKMYEFILDHNK